jgi:hypothetical protein
MTSSSSQAMSLSIYGISPIMKPLSTPLLHCLNSQPPKVNTLFVLDFYSSGSTVCWVRHQALHSSIERFVERLVQFLGASTLSLDHYRSMNAKQVQHDTLSHYILARASTFSLAAIGDLTFATECTESSQIYASNSHEVELVPLGFRLH